MDYPIQRAINERPKVLSASAAGGSPAAAQRRGTKATAQQPVRSNARKGKRQKNGGLRSTAALFSGTRTGERRPGAAAACAKRRQLAAVQFCRRREAASRHKGGKRGAPSTPRAEMLKRHGGRRAQAALLPGGCQRSKRQRPAKKRLAKATHTATAE